MSYEVSLHEIEAARMARVHAGTGEREPVRVWEIKPRVLTQEEQSADNQSLLGGSAGLLARAVKRGLAKMPPPPAPVLPGAKRTGRRWTLEQRIVQGQKLRERKLLESTKAAMSIAAQNRTEVA